MTSHNKWTFFPPLWRPTRVSCSSYIRKLSLKNKCFSALTDEQKTSPTALKLLPCTLTCVCVAVCVRSWTELWVGGRSVGTAPLSRCVAILDLREVFALLLTSAKVKEKQQLVWQGKKKTLSPFVSSVLITFLALLQLQSYSLPTITNGCRCHYLNVFFWLLLVSVFCCCCFFFHSLWSFRSPPWGSDYPGYGQDIPVSGNVLWLPRRNDGPGLWEWGRRRKWFFFLKNKLLPAV